MEEWRPVVGWEGLYEVSDLGRVRSVERLVRGVHDCVRRLPGRIKEPEESQGYRIVTLYRENRPKRRRVHHLVLEAFVGPRPPGMEGCHGPSGSADNRVSNLRWDTKSANAADSLAAGTNRNTRKTYCPRWHRLVEPNRRTEPSRQPHWRGCLACARARNRRRDAIAAGRAFDFDAVADEIYAELMGHDAALESKRLRSAAVSGGPATASGSPSSKP